MPQDESIIIKISLCQTCTGIVRAAGKDDIGKHAIREFAREVTKHNLLVKEQTLAEYRKENAKWCKCK